VAITPATKGRGSGTALKALERVFRALPVPVIGRMSEGALWFDLRCLEDADEFLAQLARLQSDTS
jgi:L-seryl-tRNA(Ser) seleniumtransferase